MVQAIILGAFLLERRRKFCSNDQARMRLWPLGSKYEGFFKWDRFLHIGSLFD